MSSAHGGPDPPRSISTHHRIALRGPLGALRFDLSAELHAPWSVLFGASGGGKSTLLRAMCGLLPTSTRSAALDLSFTRQDSSGNSTHLTNPNGAIPAEKRALAYAPQTPSLFPHLPVGANVRFGALSQGLSYSLSEQARDLFELTPLWERLPGQLSGGEQQRVNLARAFARPNSRLLLLDEPFTGMDRALRDRLLRRLRAALAVRGLPVLSVTHDVEEAFLLGADVLRLEGGRIVDQGPAVRVLSSEAGYIRAALDGETQAPG